ncbi:MAG: ABC transporter ATP-binding protein [Anaerolineales bacterium]|nr:ABC transporter ATP-binding protein [Anaerolineales bacterium]
MSSTANVDATPAGAGGVESASPDQSPILDIKDLHTYFFLERGVVKAVNGVDLSLGRQSTLGIVGESGCGKSITAMSVMQLIKSPPGKIVKGEILLRRQDGGTTIDIAKLDPKGAQMRAIRGGEIAVIFQEPMTSLNPLQSVGHQIAEVVRLHQDVSDAEAMNRALEMLQQVQISEPQRRLKQYPHQLSGGMRQRVMIAMALSCNPSILIADEPTTALDVTVQAQILQLMQDLKADFNSSIMLITHNLGVVSQMADHVAVMYLGKVVEYAPTRAIFHDPLHPYTSGLLSSVPVLGKKMSTLVPIKGMVPTPTADIKGCAFADRCPRVMKVCREETPVIREIKPEHQAACWLY